MQTEPTKTNTEAKLHQEGKLLELKVIQSSRIYSLGEMTSGVIYLINNLLASISGNISIIYMEMEKGIVDPDELKNKLQSIDEAVQRLTRSIKGLRSFLRFSEEDPKRTIPLTQIIQNVLAICEENFRVHGVKLKIIMDKDPKILCRGSQIGQALLNLINNAYDAVHAKRDSWVEIEVHSYNGLCVINVTDSGIGVEARVKEKMMNPFVTTKIGTGSGLGLTISKRIIEENLGKLYYDESFVNTRFVIELPEIVS